MGRSVRRTIHADLIRVTLRARVLESVASHAGALIEHSRHRVSAAFVQRQRDMAPGQFVVAGTAVIRGVARRASGSIERGDLAVNIVLEAGGMVHWPHHLMA